MGKSVSVVCGDGSLNHNNRIIVTENVDPDRIADDIILLQIPLSRAYADLFDSCVAEYNAKQPPCKKLKSYLDHIEHYKSDRKAFLEVIVQIGDKYDTSIGSADAQIAVEILIEYYYDFCKRNPHMRIFNAVIHLDEDSPHLHLDFIPFAHGYRTFLAAQCSMSGALRQQGYDHVVYLEPDQTDPSLARYRPNITLYPRGQWLADEREALGRIMESKGIEWEKQDVHRRHLTVSEYKACCEIVNKLIRELPPISLDTRAPNAAMRIAGVKEGELIVSPNNIEACQESLRTLTAERTILRETIHNLEAEHDKMHAQYARTMKDAKAHEKEIISKYSLGTEEKYNELRTAYEELSKNYSAVSKGYHYYKKKTENFEKSFEQDLSAAVETATSQYSVENHRLQAEINGYKKTCDYQESLICTLCQALLDTVRAVFTLKYGYTSGQKNSYQSKLTKKASLLIDALERKAQNAFQKAGHPEYTSSLGEMGVSSDLHSDVRAHMPKDHER